MQTEGSCSGDRNRTEWFYYDRLWRLLEIRSGQDKASRQFVWGSQYIDEAVCMDVDTDTAGEGHGNCTDAGSERYRYFQVEQILNEHVRRGTWDLRTIQGLPMWAEESAPASGTCTFR